MNNYQWWITQTLHYNLLLFTKRMIHIFLQSFYKSFAILFFKLKALVLFLFYIIKLLVFLYKLIENYLVVSNYICVKFNIFFAAPNLKKIQLCQIKSVPNFLQIRYNPGQNILRHFDIWQNFHGSTSETDRDY